MDITKKIVGNIIGNPRKRGGKNDWDGDGVKNKKDCQPRNTMRQDKTGSIMIEDINWEHKKFITTAWSNGKKLGAKTSTTLGNANNDAKSFISKYNNH